MWTFSFFLSFNILVWETLDTFSILQTFTNKTKQYFTIISIVKFENMALLRKINKVNLSIPSISTWSSTCLYMGKTDNYIRKLYQKQKWYQKENCIKNKNDTGYQKNRFRSKFRKISILVKFLKKFRWKFRFQSNFRKKKKLRFCDKIFQKIIFESNFWKKFNFCQKMQIFWKFRKMSILVQLWKNFDYGEIFQNFDFLSNSRKNFEFGQNFENFEFCRNFESIWFFREIWKISILVKFSKEFWFS